MSSPEVICQPTAKEHEKKRKYCEQINLVDHGVFTPLAFSTDGMSGKKCMRFIKMLVQLVGRLVEKNIDFSYSMVMDHLRWVLTFCRSGKSPACVFIPTQGFQLQLSI